MTLLPPLDPSVLPFGANVTFALLAGWTAFRVSVLWVWLRRRGHLAGVASTLPVVE